MSQLSCQSRNPIPAWMSGLSGGIWLGIAGILVSLPVITNIPPALAQAVPAALREAFTLLRQGRVKDAIAAFQEALRRYPQSLEAKLGLAIAYRRQGLIEEAWQAYQNVLAQDPNNTLALKAAGLLGTHRQERPGGGTEGLAAVLS